MKATSFVLIRPACRNDLDHLVLLLKKLFAIEKDFVFNEALQRKGLQMMLENKLGCIQVAETEGAVVGMCSGQLTVSTAEGGASLLVEDVVVDEKFRGQGIGSRLMAWIAEWAKEKGALRFQLLADRNNKGALEFYKNIGWIKTELVCLRRVE